MMTPEETRRNIEATLEALEGALDKAANALDALLEAMSYLEPSSRDEVLALLKARLRPGLQRLAGMVIH